MDGTASTLRYPWETPPAEGEAMAIADGILWMRLPLPMALNHVNIYALDDGDGWTIVDTGFNSTRTRALWTDLMAGPLGGKPVHRVILTHHHPDHVGLVGWFQSKHGAELVTTRTAWLFARMLTLDVQETPTAESLSFWRSAGMAEELYDQRASERPFNFGDVVWPMPLGFTRIAEGATLQAAGRTWDIRIGNGHAPEHATLWSRDGDLVLGGDQLLPSISPNIGVYATEPEADPLSDWLEACERLATYATDAQLVLPGHKLPFTGLPARMRQLIDNHHGALKRLLNHLKTPKTAHDCFLPLFKREITGSAYGLALVESVAHLNHLHRLGKVRRTRRDDGAWLWEAI
ncbi:MBL fold metallo-hydrolase [Actibacterium sp. 188UL27-1]|uniref:MBL fold metallo-hydrolase n=1 Tax=Actibacterium sp. 188UL27-1 TaxID=2786961 RepID=UPI001956E72C|nr:MBL fold metallo-hydrolase [Actibacterium sp. 188UL27-1]MBM7068524.1 MBL fold metallo-hydrolase [Actibacterium sp. 188UL27-1]